jgi:SPP1 family predicted phage head-tail adaptor
MKAGKLRHFGVIEALVTTQDTATGATREEWQPFVRAWAAINPLSGREFIAAQAVQAGVNTRITIRQHDGVLPSMRFSYRGTLYDIRAVLPDPTSRRHITLMCESGVSEG